ncbi:helix-turn-helix transcriptional regulator [Candidatus Puniceispirillum marinum]|uniref:Transcriptional regulator, LuxR family n=1 Tax=Puniceispirillum marinum (strain IMCC1322) TaxID=488538 RepID=D5BMG3_PUNMI|nr:helix-turn-helix transcriptional regulator [Candidatus Puniceispirillum marinum]ADE40006.1 transcriptional regulator, LuxR family [Candidatus Puniceispirillum marinum IMCC1322]
MRLRPFTTGLQLLVEHYSIRGYIPLEGYMVRHHCTAPRLLAKAITHIQHPDFESVLTAWLRAEFVFDNLLIIAYLGHQQPSLLYHQGHARTAISHVETQYLPFAYQLDPYFQLHAKGIASDVFRLDEVAPDKFQSSRYFREYYGNAKLEDELVFVNRIGDDISVHVCLGNDTANGRRFSARMIRDARALQPVVTALIEGHWHDLSPKNEGIKMHGVRELRVSFERTHGIFLTPRQAEVALMILQGHSSTSIGLNLGISAQTVKVFRRQIYRRCDISSQAELFNLIVSSR